MKTYSVYLTFDLQEAKGAAYSITYAAVGALGFMPIELRSAEGTVVRPTCLLLGTRAGNDAQEVAAAVMEEVKDRMRAADLHGDVVAIAAEPTNVSDAGDVF